MRLGRRPLALALLLLAAISLVGKTARYTTNLGDDRTVMEQAIAASLQSQGYEQRGSVDLVSGGLIRALAFVGPGCAQPLEAVVLTGSAEGNDLLSRSLDPGQYQTGFVYLGRMSVQPPLLRYLVIESVTAMARAVALPVPRQQPLFGVAQPRGCARAPVWPKWLNGPA